MRSCFLLIFKILWVFYARVIDGSSRLPARSCMKAWENIFTLRHDLFSAALFVKAQTNYNIEIIGICCQDAVLTILEIKI